MNLPLSRSDVDFVLGVMTKAGERIRRIKNITLLPEKTVDNLVLGIVTETDVATENYLKESFAKRFPSFGFYSEETAKDTASELKKEFVWIVDPIDGTLNFSRHLPQHGISVALFSGRRPLFGAIYLPHDREMYWAARGQGAFCNKRCIHYVSRPPEAKLFGASAATGLSADEHGKLWKLYYEQQLHVNKTSCSVYNLTRVADGRFDFYIGINQALWDYAAGWIIVEEAGGKFQEFYHDKERYKTTQYAEWFIAGNQKIIDEMVPRLTALFIKS